MSYNGINRFNFPQGQLNSPLVTGSPQGSQPPVFPYQLYTGSPAGPEPSAGLNSGMPWDIDLSAPTLSENPGTLFPSWSLWPTPYNPLLEDESQQSPQQAGRKPGETALVEIGVEKDGNADEHAQSVQEVFERHNPNAESQLTGIDTGNVQGANTESLLKNSNVINTQEKLDTAIDAGSTDAFRLFSDKIDAIVIDGSASVINGSLGYSRNEIYRDTLNRLKANPYLAKHLDLKPEDITGLESDEKNRTVITEKVSTAIVSYVDQRLDAPDSEFQKARQHYQNTTRNAAEKGVVVVVAAGNQHKLNGTFEKDTLGGDTNFLAQSNSVISVAASDNQDTENLADDTIADFSSRGDGEFNPTIATDGVGIETEFGKQNGTSFAAPKVAATIARLQQENPQFNFHRIKEQLKSTAVNTEALELAEGAGILDTSTLLASPPESFNTGNAALFSMA
ncbi:S8 family serine peptidase [Vampirovibrio sp.]|uniref:S8 family serine peptidase n=1 Tax=Vampirovibrio sp. TaxID=2717857 RepID=UPI0035947901